MAIESPLVKIDCATRNWLRLQIAMALDAHENDVREAADFPSSRLAAATRSCSLEGVRPGPNLRQIVAIPPLARGGREFGKVEEHGRCPVPSLVRSAAFFGNDHE